MRLVSTRIGHDLRQRGDAVTRGGDDSGDVGAVRIAGVGLVRSGDADAAGAGDAARDPPAEVGVGDVDPGIEYGDGDPAPAAGQRRSARPRRPAGPTSCR